MMPLVFDNKNITIDSNLDACGLACPLPLLKAKQALNKLANGQILAVVCTDPGSVRDFQVFCQQSGHELLNSSEHKDDTEQVVYSYLLRKT